MAEMIKPTGGTSRTRIEVTIARTEMPKPGAEVIKARAKRLNHWLE